MERSTEYTRAERKKLLNFIASGSGPLFVQLINKESEVKDSVHIRKDSVKKFIKEKGVIYWIFLYDWENQIWVLMN